ncbi:tetratricopeptide repeat protein [Paractinoplanes toevensis]|uniref:NB-ARC domain-containing protein n=1 Tax=Paractinoplanes toevensis TaxID=571911 RepID=A0A919WB26_9ACTN|nr:tetratricopeptide repeat protein [Actinoplanes toevensis]GIM96865.1 hypothetical protein Ato02nite_086580 [Actinoplanes toevensis]
MAKPKKHAMQRPLVDGRRAKGVQVGSGNKQYNFFAGREVVSWPHQIGVVPVLADGFQTRQPSCDLSRVGTSRQSAVLTGPAGVGKTQLAAAYAHQLRNDGAVDLLMWVAASNRQAILTSYSQAAADILAVDDHDAEHAAGQFLAWLASTRKSWLVVLDDLTDLADLHRLWPPAVMHGNAVITTRRRDAAISGLQRRTINVGLFSAQESESFLAARLVNRPDLADTPADLGGALGHLPLALGQATAYILDQEITCSTYCRLLADQERRLADLRPTVLPDDQHNGLAAAWSLSTDLANRMPPQGIALPLLQLASVLDANGVPDAVFSTQAVIVWLTAARLSDAGVPGNVRKLQHALRRFWGADAAQMHGIRKIFWTVQRRSLNWLIKKLVGDNPVSAATSRDASRRLHLLSLVTHDPRNNSRSLRVHALVQRATREEMPHHRLAQIIRVAADALVEAWPPTEGDPELSQAFRANALAVATLLPDSLWTPVGAHPVLARAGLSLGDAGQAAAAAVYFQQLHASAHERLGPDHPETLNARHAAAGWRGDAGDPAGAVAAFEEVLNDQLRVLGPDHPDTLKTRVNLAGSRGKAGDKAAAAADLQVLLVDTLQVLGPDHPNTLSIRHNLASWRGEAGDPAGAVAALQELVIARTRVLGRAHFDTLSTRHQLGYWHGEAGDPAAAVTILQELLTDLIQVLPPNHPTTLTTRLNLACWRGEAGDPAAAVTALEGLLADQIQVLGPDDPDTLQTRSSIAYWRNQTSKISRRS